MSEISIALDSQGRFLLMSGDMGRNISFRTGLVKTRRVEKILIDDVTAVRINYDFRNQITSVTPGAAAHLLHLSYGDYYAD